MLGGGLMLGGGTLGGGTLGGGTLGGCTLGGGTLGGGTLGGGKLGGGKLGGGVAPHTLCDFRDDDIDPANDCPLTPPFQTPVPASHIITPPYQPLFFGPYLLISEFEMVMTCDASW